MRYREAFSYINSFTNYEREPGMGQDLGLDGLERVRLLMRLLGRPQNSFRSIVIAGTKGKGSVAAMIDSVLREAGHNTGFFTSPHLHTFRERIRFNGAMISPEDMARIVDRIQPIVERIRSLGDHTLLPTTYELAVAIAFLYFEECGVEVTVLEVGLGGRLDAVNIVDPVVSVITSISLDHMSILGDTVAAIAQEKAGIIKQGGRVISAPQSTEAMRVLSSVAAEKHATLTVVGAEVYVGTGHLPEVLLDEEGIPIYQVFTVGFEAEGRTPANKMRIKLPLLGNHQQINAAVALAALRTLPDVRVSDVSQGGIAISREAIFRGFANVQWPGRLEIVHRDPTVIVDGAHNVESMSKLNQAISDLFHGHKAIVVLGISRDKDVEGIVGEIGNWLDSMVEATVERVIITRSRHPRAADPREVAHYAVSRGLTVEIRDTVPKALARASTIAKNISPGNAEPVILVTGSLFVVAEAREHYGLAPDLSEEG
jgi:dihydrofolate synthase/folylpolyglutamate synthase